MSVPRLSRRSVLRGLAVAAGGGVVGYVVAQASNAADPQPDGAANGYGPSKGGGAEALAALSDIPADGGLVTGGVVLIRDASGDVHALSATCTHQGCTVSAPQNGVLSCPCHGSTFDASTGDVINGPATRPLPVVSVKVRGDSVFRS